MAVLRTPEACFEELSGFHFEPNYLEIPDEDLGPLQIHYLDEGPKDGPVVLCLHGEPTWCYLYRKMIPVFVAAGLRVLAPDLVGFGRSDKPSERRDYSYRKHVKWMADWLKAVGASDITLLGQDWGGLIGLRLLAENPEQFVRFSLANTALPTGDHAINEAFHRWRKFSQEDPDFDTGFIVNLFGRGSLSEEEIRAYRAPFPSDEYKAGARQFPLLVPTRPDDPAADDNRRAWKVLMQWEKPALMCFSDADPIMKGGDRPFLKQVPGTRGQPHITLQGHHFIQEEDGENWARAVAGWIQASPP
ncbi:MAG: alpha/beta fold hydrolase [Gammaproteobacteria bacterium]|jgi:haloalkane dehalogenase|nr:alpha/beta fold hydrolase [Gammaproteobacteria bacterium]